MLSFALNTASRSRRCRRLVEALPLTRRVVDRFVPGEKIADAVAAARILRAEGKEFTIDVLGEDVHDLAGAQRTRDSYVELLVALGKAGLSPADVSIKLSALGQALKADGTDVAYRHAYEICDRAQAVGSTVTIDMEDHTTVDSTISTVERLRNDFPWVGNVLQSNLKRTDADVSKLARRGTRVRIVKGAYLEPSHVAYEAKADVDAAYARHIDALMVSECYAMIATHDPVMLERARAQADLAGRSRDSWECQLLYGIRTDLQDAYARNSRVRVYIPFGGDWYGYFMRRLAERPANVMFFLRALLKH